MADKQDVENLNIHHDVCVYCHSEIPKVCLTCQAMRELAANSMTNETKVEADKLSDTIGDDIDIAPMLQHIDQEIIASVPSPQVCVSDMIRPGDRDSDCDSDTSSNIYANNISDSSRSSDTSSALKEIIENMDKGDGHTHIMDMYRDVMHQLKNQSLIVDGKSVRDSDSGSDSDLPSLEQINKIINESGEDSDDIGSLEKN